MKVFALTIGGAMLVSNLAAEAHHSFGGTYNVAKQITITGKMVQVSLRMPHSFFYVEVLDSNGVPQRWAIEASAGGQLVLQGVTKDTFRVGDPIEVVVNPSRSPNSTRGRLIKITRTTDGKSWGTRAGETVD